MKRMKGNGIGYENNLSEPTPASAEEVFSNIDLLEEILLRVPAKPLVRMKCVSMYWLRLISSPRFGYKHTTQNPKSISALYYRVGSFYALNDLKSVSLRGDSSLPTLSFLKGFVIVLQAHNGLMLCFYDGPHKYVVCNLTTQKHSILQQRKKNGSYVYISRLVYDPAVSPYYKVVLIWNWDRHLGSWPIDIYSSQTLSWKRIHAPVPETLIGCLWHEAFCNGAIHWICAGNKYFRFEVDAEKLIGAPLPSELPILESNKVKFFGECGGNLLLIQYSSRYVVGFKIFQMDMENCRWILKQRVSLRPIEHAFPDGRIRFKLLTVFNGTCEDDIIAVLAIEGKVIAYHPKGQTFKVISHTSPEDFKKHVQKGDVYQHFESLSPV